jgi:hypothetical protein
MSNPRRAGAQPATIMFFNNLFTKTGVEPSLNNINTALPAFIEMQKSMIAESYTTGSIENSNPTAAGAQEVASKQLFKTMERYQSYRSCNLVSKAINRMTTYLENPTEDTLDELYVSFDKLPDPPMLDNPYEKTYFTSAEYRRTMWDNFTVFAIASDFTDQIGYAWTSGIAAVPGANVPWLAIKGAAAAGGASSPTLEQKKEAVGWIVNFMYFQRALQAVTWFDENGDGITDIPDAIANRAEYKRLLAKEKAGDLNLDDALALKRLKAAAAAGDFTNIGELDTVDDVNKVLRFTEQTILMRNLKSFAENYTALAKKRKEKYEKTYLMYGKPSEMVNKLTLKPGMSTFLNFRTDQISQLAPKFKLFQVVYGEKNEFKEEIEYKFASKNNITAGDLTQAAILEARGREAVGVKSFEWEYIGTNPVTARNDLKAKLELYFQSFDDLFQERTSIGRDGKPYKYRYVDLILRNPDRDGKQANWNCSDPVDSSDKTQISEKFETKIIVGWNFKGTNLEKTVKEDNTQITDLSYFNEVLFMTLIDHEFGIEEDGTLSLSITYRARLDALLQDKRSDILATTNIITKRAQIEGQIKKLQKECEKSDESREALKKLKDDYEETKQKFRQESYQSIIDELSGKGEKKAYPRLFHIGIDIAKFVAGGNSLDEADEYLYDADTAGITVATEMIKMKLSDKISNSSQVSAKSISSSQMIANQYNNTMDNVEFAQTATGIDTAGETALAAPLLLTPPGQLILQGAALYNAVSGLAELYSNYETNSANASFEETGEIPEDINKFLRTTVDIRDGVYNIHYFFLGDLVEMLSQRVLNSDLQSHLSNSDTTMARETLDNIRIILGTMEFFPRAKGAAQVPYRINLGALPISLMVFNNFMMRRVLAKKRDVYSLLDFIRDFMKYLLDEVLGANSEESDNAMKMDVEVKSTVLTMPGKPSGVGGKQTIDPIADKILENQGKKISLSPDAMAAGSIDGLTIDLDTINERNTIVPYTNPESNSANRGYHYLTIYVENKSPSHLRGIEEYDREAGIYHFHIGENRSIFKRANFKKTDAKYLREARFVETSYNPLSTLANVYDVDIEMFGNTIFYPGQYLFINPFGLGREIGLPWDCSSMSNVMGLGGYHLVTGVSSVMDEDGFSTSITARFEYSGDGRQKKDNRTSADTPACSNQEATEIK